MLTDLSKAFDCISHELLIAKLHAYGSDKRSLVLIYNYHSDRKRRVKVNDWYSSWSEILFGGRQGPILAPLLFNIFICDMFYFMEVLNFEIANYADDSTPFSAKLNHKSGVGELEISSSVLFIWFRNNYIKANTDKSHILPSGSNQLTADIYGNDTESEDN